ncbi:unnamed protein product [Blepharisma stoltei]|uniref:Uncharacterized protein n=1 Tax=Blepharisma stoltei TaxID=1481888 RepID=A0AAU9IRZ8_9CILI|nr:unnamed protein product [Blepharisma stoltei]
MILKRKISTKIGSVFDFIPAVELEKAVRNKNITPQEAYDTKKADLTRYYNRKLMLHIKYQQWDDFFYIYHSACQFNHGADIATHIIAAHGYVIAYKNTTKAHQILDKLEKNPGVDLSKTFIKTWEELNKLGIAPVTPEWAVVVGMCSAVALGTPTPLPKLMSHLQTPRAAWHYELRPWRYPNYQRELADDLRFIQRGEH